MHRSGGEVAVAQVYSRSRQGFPKEGAQEHFSILMLYKLLDVLVTRSRRGRMKNRTPSIQFSSGQARPAAAAPSSRDPNSKRCCQALQTWTFFRTSCFCERKEKSRIFVQARSGTRLWGRYISPISEFFGCLQVRLFFLIGLPTLI